MLNHYHTASESAKILGISRVTLYRWIRQGKLKPISAWGRSFFTISQLKPYVTERCSNCYHHNNNRCSCREQADMETQPSKCSDWAWKWK